MPYRDFIVPPWQTSAAYKEKIFYETYQNLYIQDTYNPMLKPYRTFKTSYDSDIDYSVENIKRFWKNYYLYKHKADEQENGEDIFVYSIVLKSQWDTGKKDIVDDPASYMSWASYFPEDTFEEVAANWFELLVEEEQLTSKYGIKVVT